MSTGFAAQNRSFAVFLTTAVRLRRESMAVPFGTIRFLLLTFSPRLAYIGAGYPILYGNGVILDAQLVA